MSDHDYHSKGVLNRQEETDLQEYLQSLLPGRELEGNLPEFLKLIGDCVRISIIQQNLEDLIKYIQIIDTLLKSNELRAEDYLTDLVPCLEACLLTQHLCLRPSVDNHWELRQLSGNILARIIKKETKASGSIRALLVGKFQNLLSTCMRETNDNSLETLYGVAFCTGQLGHSTCMKIIVPNLHKIGSRLSHSEQVGTNQAAQKFNRDVIMDIVADLFGVGLITPPHDLEKAVKRFGNFFGREIFKTDFAICKETVDSHNAVIFVKQPSQVTIPETEAIDSKLCDGGVCKETYSGAVKATATGATMDRIPEATASNPSVRLGSDQGLIKDVTTVLKTNYTAVNDGVAAIPSKSITKGCVTKMSTIHCLSKIKRTVKYFKSVKTNKRSVVKPSSRVCMLKDFRRTGIKKRKESRGFKLNEPQKISTGLSGVQSCSIAKDGFMEWFPALTDTNTVTLAESLEEAGIPDVQTQQTQEKLQRNRKIANSQNRKPSKKSRNPSGKTEGIQAPKTSKHSGKNKSANTSPAAVATTSTSRWKVMEVTLPPPDCVVLLERTSCSKSPSTASEMNLRGKTSGSNPLPAPENTPSVPKRVSSQGKINPDSKGETMATRSDNRSKSCVTEDSESVSYAGGELFEDPSHDEGSNLSELSLPSSSRNAEQRQDVFSGSTVPNPINGECYRTDRSDENSTEAKLFENHSFPDSSLLERVKIVTSNLYKYVNLHERSKVQ